MIPAAIAICITNQKTGSVGSTGLPNRGNLTRAIQPVERRSIKASIIVQQITPATAKKLGIPADTEGVAVVSAADGSAASLADPPIMPGDIILEVNQQPTQTVAGSMTSWPG